MNFALVENKEKEIENSTLKIPRGMHNVTKWTKWHNFNKNQDSFLGF